MTDPLPKACVPQNWLADQFFSMIKQCSPLSSGQGGFTMLLDRSDGQWNLVRWNVLYDLDEGTLYDSNHGALDFAVVSSIMHLGH